MVEEAQQTEAKVILSLDHLAPLYERGNNAKLQKLFSTYEEEFHARGIRDQIQLLNFLEDIVKTRNALIEKLRAVYSEVHTEEINDFARAAIQALNHYSFEEYSGLLATYKEFIQEETEARKQAALARQEEEARLAQEQVQREAEQQRRQQEEEQRARENRAERDNERRKRGFEDGLDHELEKAQKKTEEEEGNRQAAARACAHIGQVIQHPKSDIMKYKQMGLIEAIMNYWNLRKPTQKDREEVVKNLIRNGLNAMVGFYGIVFVSLPQGFRDETAIAIAIPVFGSYGEVSEFVINLPSNADLFDPIQKVTWPIILGDFFENYEKAGFHGLDRTSFSHYGAQLAKIE